MPNPPSPPSQALKTSANRKKGGGLGVCMCPTLLCALMHMHNNGRQAESNTHTRVRTHARTCTHKPARAHTHRHTGMHTNILYLNACYGTCFCMCVCVCVCLLCALFVAEVCVCVCGQKTLCARCAASATISHVLDTQQQRNCSTGLLQTRFGMGPGTQIGKYPQNFN